MYKAEGAPILSKREGYSFGAPKVDKTIYNKGFQLFYLFVSFIDKMYEL